MCSSIMAGMVMKGAGAGKMANKPMNKSKPKDKPKSKMKKKSKMDTTLKGYSSFEDYKKDKIKMIGM